MLIAANEQASAAQLFEEAEGIDIHPAAAIATASLIEAAKNNSIDKDALIMLNITGGGEKRFKAEKELFFLTPDLIFDIDAEPDMVKEQVDQLFR